MGKAEADGNNCSAPISKRSVAPEPVQDRLFEVDQVRAADDLEALNKQPVYETDNHAKYIQFSRELLKTPLLALSSVEHIESNIRGVYFLYYTNPQHPDYKKWAPIATERPVYIGKSSKCIGKRLRDHLASIQGSSNLEVDDFEIRILKFSDPDEASHVENVFLTYCGSPWNGSGFGANKQGQNRSTQNLSAWDAAHGGRKQTKHAEEDRRSAKVREQLTARVEKFKDRVEKFRLPLAKGNPIRRQ